MGKEFRQGLGRLAVTPGKLPELAEARGHLGLIRRAEFGLAVDPADRVDL